MLRYLTAGESHGKALITILEGVPANVDINAELINKELRRRQKGYGRGSRMLIESDEVEILSGVRHGKSLGSPIALMIKNIDYEKWEAIMAIEPLSEELQRTIKKVTQLRPGHADYPGVVKYHQDDIRNILERSSARETAMRVAVGAVAKAILAPLNIYIFSHVTNIGGIEIKPHVITDVFKLEEMTAESEVRCIDAKISNKMMERISLAKSEGVSVGGKFEVVVNGIPVGLGSHVHWDRRLDGRLGHVIMSIQGVKAVEIGLGIGSAYLDGRKVHDEFFMDGKNVRRRSNHAGGLEGGMTNGEPLILIGTMKPIPTMIQSLPSVDFSTLTDTTAHVERADVCAVPAAGVVAEAVVAIELVCAIQEKFGGDHLDELLSRIPNADHCK